MQLLQECGVILEGAFLTLKRNGRSVALDAPSFPLAGSTELKLQSVTEERLGTDGVYAQIIHSMGDTQLTTELIAYRHTPIVRFRYHISGGKFVGRDGVQCIRYTGIHQPFTSYTNMELSHFDRLTHNYTLHEQLVQAESAYACSFAGPMLFVRGQEGGVYLAYEHGATMPDHYLRFDYEGESFTLSSAKGNYYGGQAAEEYRAPWIQVALYSGADLEIKKAIRNYFLNDINPNHEPAKPYLYYNTWGIQAEENVMDGKPYLDSMNEERILEQVDICHKIGIDVFVIDAGWFVRTGEYEESFTRLKNGLAPIRERLNSYGMRLGLWFDPASIGKDSSIYRDHPELWDTFHGQHVYQGVLWETEESYKACLASPYSDMFIEKCVECYEKYGVTYFKWDGLHQYECDRAGHWHGGEGNDAEERHACYSYRVLLEKVRIAEEVGKRIPGAIVDLDVTESQRIFGLAFLSAGKYFYCNSSIFGPHPHHKGIDLTDPERVEYISRYYALQAQACRKSIMFDEIFPSTLFLAHFIPNRPIKGQHNSLTSLMLGNSGIWGHVDRMDEEDIALFADSIREYKRVRESVAAAYPIVSGFNGSSPEIHEKIVPEKAEGLVAFFTHEKGTLTHITQPIDVTRLAEIKGADSWEQLPDDRLKITVTLDNNDARTVFVFSKEC